MRALVTGGAGFIGSHLVKLLLQEGISVKVYDNFSTGSINNLESVKSDIEIINADIRDFDTLALALQGIDWVFHQAALVSVPESLNHPKLTDEINVQGSINVLWASVKNNVSRVVCASSCAVYGDGHQPPLKEIDLPLPKSPYAASKLTVEAWAESFYQSYGLETACLRYFNVYGPGQKANSDYAAVIPLFLDCYRQKRHPKVYGDGRQTRDFIHVTDVALANLSAAKLASSVIQNHKVFNVGNGKGVTLLQLLDIIAEKKGYFLEPEFYPARTSDIRNSWADLNRLNHDLHFMGHINIDNGIQSMIV